MQSISKKLKTYKIKVATVIARCEDLDRNRDHMINLSDLEQVFEDLLGFETVSTRELRQLAIQLGADKNNRNQVQYNLLYELLDDSSSREPAVERWYDPQEPEEETQKGTVGEWLQKAACPAEVKNFRKFIACLEEFERSSGMKCVNKEDGFTVPLGPDLRASISFFMT